MNRIYKYYLYCLFVLLGTSCHHARYIQQHTASLYTVDTTAGKEQQYVQMLQPYRKTMDSIMNVPIGVADTILYKSQPEGTLGDFMADAILQAARQQDSHVDAAILNNGGIRLPYMSSGTIAVGKIYELMPFDNQLTIIEIPGDTLIRFCNHMAMAGGWPVSGISYAIKDKKAINILVNGRAIDAAKVYQIATNDYLANGGDYCSFFTQLKRTTTPLLIRDVCIDYVKGLAKQGRHLHPYIDKRVYNAE